MVDDSFDQLEVFSIDFRKIEYFLKAAELLNFSEAARALFISPQALNQQIVQLEEDLKTRLFVRSTRKISLTETGQLCYCHFASVKLAFDQAVGIVEQEISSIENTIRVGFFNALPKNEIVTPWLGIIEASYPMENIDMLSGDLHAIWHEFELGHLDLCLTNIDARTDLSDYKVTTLLTMPSKIVVSENHPWSSKNKITPRDMKQEVMLQLQQSDPKSGSGHFYKTAPCRSIRYTSDFDTLLATLENGHYFAVFPQTFDFRDQARFKYFDLPDPYPFNCNTVCLSRKDNPKAKVHKLFQKIERQLDQLGLSASQ